MNLRDALQTRSDTKAIMRYADRFVLDLKNALGPARTRAFQSEACKPVREQFARATTEFARAMVECDGSPEAVCAVNRASHAYLVACRDTHELAAEVAHGRAEVTGPFVRARLSPPDNVGTE